MEQKLQFEEAETILSCLKLKQMSDEEKAAALKQLFEQLSDEEVGSYVNLEQMPNEYLVASMKLGVKHVSAEEARLCLKEFPVAKLNADMKQFSHEEIAENMRLGLKQMSKEQIGKLFKDCVKHSSKEYLAAIIKLEQEYCTKELQFEEATAEQAVKLIETKNFPDDFTKKYAIGNCFGFVYAAKGKEEALKFAEKMEIPYEKACELISFIKQVQSEEDIKDFDTFYAREQEKLEKMIACDHSGIEYLNRLKKADQFLSSLGF